MHISPKRNSSSLDNEHGIMNKFRVEYSHKYCSSPLCRFAFLVDEKDASTIEEARTAVQKWLDKNEPSYSVDFVTNI